MSNDQVTYVVAAACGLLALGSYLGLILVPAMASYSRWWERICAAFLSVYVLLAFLGAGAVAGLGIAWFWDRLHA
jgi:hypothetical protein